MALGAALVDRARVIRAIGQGVSLPPPRGLLAREFTTLGTLASATYLYSVTAVDPDGETVPSAEVAAVVVGPQGRVRLEWQAVVGATSYRVYRRVGAGLRLRLAETAAPRYKDDGSTAPAPPGPPVVGTALGRASGASLVVDVAGSWFRARLTLPAAPEVADATGRRRTVTVPTLMYGPRDDAGADVLLTVEDYVDVDSPQLGRAAWQVSAMPEPMRKRRTVLGWTVTLRRVEARSFEEVA